MLSARAAATFVQSAGAAPMPRGRIREKGQTVAVESSGTSRPARAEPRLSNWLVLNPNFVLLWLAYGIAAFGDHLSEMALLKERGGLTRPDVTRIQALMTFGFFLPFVVLGSLAGWWSDRFSRRTTMIAADLLRAALVFNMAWIVATLAGWLPAAYGDYAIILPLVVIGTLAAFFSPARQALLPTLVRPDQLVRANALISALGTIGAILSAIVGGALVNRGLYHENFHINAGTFLASAFCVWGISMRRARTLPHAKLEGVWQPLRDGFRYVRSHARALQLIALASVYWGAAGVGISVVPAIAKLYFGENYAAAGTLRGVLALGLATGAAVMTVIGPTLPVAIAFLAGLSGAAFWLLLLAAAVVLHWGAIVAGACLFGMGGAGAAILVSVMATLQRVVPDSRRGRVFGVSDMCTMAAMVVTTGALGLPNIPRLDSYVPWLLGFTGGAMLITTIVAWRTYRRGDTHSAAVWWLWRIIRFYVAFWGRTKRTGICTVPPHGPVLIVSNHTSGIDPLVIIGTCPNRLPGFLVEEAYYDAPIVGRLMRLNRCVPVDRTKPGKSALTESIRLLEQGGCLGVFPEGGYVAPDAPAPEPKDGVGLLALRTSATVIPVHISGTRYADHPMMSLFRRHDVRIRYGRPVDLRHLDGRAADRDAQHQATQAIMDAIRALGVADNHRAD